MYSEKVGRIINANDMSGSIDQKQVNEFGAELASICETAEPDEVVTLWWDTEVRGEQVFKPDSFQNIKALLKPRGGGGTHVSCVHHYVQAKRLTADCIIVMTDGYVEHDIKWSNEIPTLWLVTQNESFVPPFGRVVKMQK
jgi:predicted metal-dependent peptidase